VVSNAEGQVEQDLVAAGFGAYLETVVDSHRVGVAKPDPRIFAIALGRLGAGAEQALYVGDVPPTTSPARARRGCPRCCSTRGASTPTSPTRSDREPVGAARATRNLRPAPAPAARRRAGAGPPARSWPAPSAPPGAGALGAGGRDRLRAPFADGRPQRVAAGVGAPAALARPSGPCAAAKRAAAVCARSAGSSSSIRDGWPSTESARRRAWAARPPSPRSRSAGRRRGSRTRRSPRRRGSSRRSRRSSATRRTGRSTGPAGDVRGQADLGWVTIAKVGSSGMRATPSTSCPLPRV